MDFDRWSRTYENSWMQRLIFDPVQRGLLTIVNTNDEAKTILDIGCGTGRLLRKARERWPKAELIGVDASEGMVEKARQLTRGVRFYVGMAESLPLPDCSVDLAFSTVSFHHWSDKLTGIRDVARVLRSGGQFYLADIQITPLMAGIAAFFAPKSPHASVNTPSTVQEMFVKAGLAVQVEGTFWHRFEIVGRKP
jgi:ubiquinone/menaquinone biosynthesis C-methylase UbiE